MRNNGTFPVAEEQDGFRISPDHRFPGAATWAVRPEAFRELVVVIADLERRVRALEAADGNGNGERG